MQIWSRNQTSKSIKILWDYEEFLIKNNFTFLIKSVDYCSLDFINSGGLGVVDRWGCNSMKIATTNLNMDCNSLFNPKVDFFGAGQGWLNKVCNSQQYTKSH